jgi:filamin
LSLPKGSFNLPFLPRYIETEVVEKDGFFDIFYMLPEPGTFDVDVKFGGKQVPNGLMRMTVK